MHSAVSSFETRSVASSVLASVAVLAALAALAGRLSGLGVQFVVASLVLFLLALLPVLFFAWRHLHGGSFGAANGVTLLRLALTALLGALLLAPAHSSILWLCIVVATATLLLDGVDGKLARRYGLSSRFGARFDMEVDALLILVLALLVWHFERAGVWVLAAGLIRYAFVAAAYVFPWLRASLPDSVRRKTVCILQSTFLLIAMGPIIPAAIAPLAAALGVAMLVWSFALDIRWLFVNRHAGA